ncbi:DUF285 domain-containing protein [Skeletonema marinoi]|uniref:DUF285 domain-containing protein n=1 Tax=Skeletonema marinoi TaxID=267567 RepID=A0AAD9DBP9_9STRA|nr:DUF285 domain-containing protein [Skeletonema marinoi]
MLLNGENVISMRSMFEGASSFVGDISSWNTAAVDMSSMFRGASSFAQEDLSRWDTSAVTTMRGMFYGASSFDGDISAWNTAAVFDLNQMFKGATSFNQDLCAWEDDFPYSSATDIFEDSGCTIESDPSSVHQGPFCASYCNVVSTTDCFAARDELKAAVYKYVYLQEYWGIADSSKYGWPIGSWCVNDVTDMSGLFRGRDTFNEDISGWNVGQVTDMNSIKVQPGFVKMEYFGCYNYAENVLRSIVF